MDVPIEHLLRELTPQVLGTVVRRFRDFAAAADAVQEASLAAAGKTGSLRSATILLTQTARLSSELRLMNKQE